MIARRAGGPETILLRSLDSPTVQPLAGTEGAFNVFWSPDSRFLGFSGEGNKLKKIDTSGGPPTTVSDVPGFGGGTWNRNGIIVLGVFVGASPRIQAVSANGGAPATVASTSPNEGLRPWFLPDGRRFLYFGGRDATRPDGSRPLYAASLDSPERVKIAELRSAYVQYAHGHLLFVQDGALMAQPFDVQRLAMSGDAFPVAVNVAGGGTGGGGPPPVGFFSVSDTGILVYQPGTPGSGIWLAWVDRTGKVIGSVGDRADYRTVALSPDASRIATAIRNDLWIVDSSRGVSTRFTFDGIADESSPAWSADGGRIAFASSRRDTSGKSDKPFSHQMYQKSSNGTEPEEVLVGDDDVATVPWDLSRDGRFLLYGRSPSGRFRVDSDFVLLPLLGDRKPRPLLTTPFGETRGKFSPDGRWIAYQSDESGNDEIYVVPFSGDADAGRLRAAAGKLRVSTNGGTMPRWRRDGKELFFLDSNEMLMAVEVDARGDALQLGEITPLFAVRGSPIGSQYTYDVSPDGQRFLVTTEQDPRSDAPSRPITIVVNWLEGLRK
jgi:Tol biopolymer transport system component